MSTSEIAKLESRWRENPNGLTFAPLAEAYRKQKDPQRALEILTPGLEKHPDYIPANIVLGRCHWDLNDLAAAERAFTYVLGLDGENVIALKALADVTERLVRYDEAERWLETLLAVDRSNDEARAQLERIRELQREQAEGSAAIPGAAAVAVAEVAALPQVDIEEPESPVIDEPAAPPEAFESAPEPPALEEAAAVEYIGWVAKPEDVPPSAPLSLEELEGADAAGEQLEAAVSPLDGPQEPVMPSPPPLGVDAFGIEHREEIVLNPAGQTEYQTPSALDDLMADVTGTPRGSIDDLRRDLAPPEPITSALNDLDSYELEPPAAAVEPSATADPVEAERPASTPTARTAEFYALEEPPAPPAPAQLEPARAVVDDLGDAPAVAEPELVVTETMAEVFLRQGHLAEALTVYRELLRRSPESPHLAARIGEVEARQAAASAPPPKPAYAARDTGGQSVGALFQTLLGARPGDPPMRWPSRVEPSTPDPAPEAASATRPAPEPLSLGSVFGDEPPPVTPAMRGSADAPSASAGPAPVSFDDFFGAPHATGISPPSPPGRATAARRGDDLEQFHAWLQSLKR
jgi:tetratricopeptide (TPR) repeat protein